MQRPCDYTITLVPIYIGYEHVMEVATPMRRSCAVRPRRKSLPQMLRGLGKLRNLGGLQ